VEGPYDDGKRSRGMNWVIEKVPNHIGLEKQPILKPLQGEEVTKETMKSIRLFIVQERGKILHGQSLELFSCSLDTSPEKVNHEREYTVLLSSFFSYLTKFY
jgi:hypothetical protein